MDGMSTIVIALCAVLLTGIGTATAISKRMMSKEDCLKMQKSGAAITASEISKNVVSREDCKAAQEHCGLVRQERFITSNAKVEHIQHSIEELKYSTEIQQGMLVAIVQNLPNLSNEKKTEIINYRPGRKP